MPKGDGAIGSRAKRELTGDNSNEQNQDEHHREADHNQWRESAEMYAVTPPLRFEVKKKGSSLKSGNQNSVLQKVLS
jgi:hypothetical protein